MIRNLKALGLAMMALFALGAVIASAASAQQGVLTSDGPVTLTFTETGAQTANRMTAFGAYVQCPGSTYTGHEVISQHDTETELGLEHEPLPETSTTATLTPHYKEVNGEGKPNCTGPFGWTMTIHMNGCDYVMHLGNTVEEDTYDVTFDVVCPSGNEITWTIWRGGTSHATNPFCVIHIPPQEGLEGAHLTDTDTNDGHVEVNGTLEGTEMTRTTQTGPHHSALLCGNTTTQTAKFDIDITIAGHNEAGGDTDIKLTD
jgi:uncharacterized cupredoxin-like copper-binding protein